MSLFLHSPVPLATKDFIFFHSSFCSVVQSLLPVHGAVFFWDKDKRLLTKEQAQRLLGQERQRLLALCEEQEPALINNCLFLPLAMGDGSRVAVVIADIDAGLLRKMSPEWLQELRADVQDALVNLKQAYVYPETGLYSSHVLDLFWEEFMTAGGAFFLVGIRNRVRTPASGFMALRAAGIQLEAAAGIPAVYFGGNVFGIHQIGISRSGALLFARRLLGRLKREGLHRVHVGIAVVQEQNGQPVGDVLGECWPALEAAEKRGPFSLCEASFLKGGKSHPLALPENGVLRQLQKKWRGLDQFSLLLVRKEVEPKKGKKESVSLTRLVQENMPDGFFSVEVNPVECFILLPGIPARKAVGSAALVKGRVEAGLGHGKVAVGISYWPCLGFPRKATMVNCRKALMHGDFFGPGSITLFDHVSLNVSGDYFYDEGDYRQAVNEYRFGLRLEPGEVNLLNSLGVALTELNRLKEAVEYFDLVLEKEPGNFMALVNKGFALRMFKREKEALVCLESAAQCREFVSSPVAADISLQLGRLYHAMGRHEDVLRVLEKMKLRKTEKNGYLLYSLLGSAYAATGRSKKAVSILQKAVRHNPQDAHSLSILGDLYSSEGEGDEIAFSLCANAVDIDDRSWENWYRLARVRFRSGDIENALGAVREALRRNNASAEAMHLAGQIYAELGQEKRSKAMMRKVLLSVPDFKPGS